jgi:hypothetical protein
MQEDGLIAIPASYGAFWYDTLKKDGRIKPNAMQHVGSRFHDAMGDRRPIQVGEKLYLTNMEFAPNEIVFYLQSCGKCDSSVDPNDAPYRARLAFQFEKEYLSTADPKQVLETTGRVFAIDTSSTTAGPATPPPPPPPASPLKLPSSYVSAQAPTDQLQLNADSSFSLQEAGQTYHGSFAVNGNTLELSISETNTKTTVTRQGGNLTDSSGQTWVLREQSAGTAPGGATLQNDDVVKMAKAGFDDAIILAKISSSKCQFDTSTDALIRLRQSGVSAVVIRAIVTSGR